MLTEHRFHTASSHSIMRKGKHWVIRLCYFMVVRHAGKVCCLSFRPYPSVGTCMPPTFAGTDNRGGFLAAID